MKKLQEAVTQSLASFDEKLVKLFHQKIKTEMVVNQVGLGSEECRWWSSGAYKYYLAHNSLPLVHQLHWSSNHLHWRDPQNCGWLSNPID